MKQQNKRWFFYDEKGSVHLIYLIEPPSDLLEGNNVIQGIESDVKEGYNIEYTVDLQTRKLKANYIKKAETIEEKISKLQAKNKELGQTIDDLLLMNLQ